MPDNGNLAGLLADHGTRTDMRVLRDDCTADDCAALDNRARHDDRIGNLRAGFDGYARKEDGVIDNALAVLYSVKKKDYENG